MSHDSKIYNPRLLSSANLYKLKIKGSGLLSPFYFIKNKEYFLLAKYVG